jgi:hypothetical protein
MVQVLKRRPISVFRVFDRDGRAIGDVVQPRSAPVMEHGAGTVLLVRGSTFRLGHVPGRPTAPGDGLSH